MICPNCNNENREGAKFCDACGFPLSQTTNKLDLPSREEKASSGEPAPSDEQPVSAHEPVDLPDSDIETPIADDNAKDEEALDEPNVEQGELTSEPQVKNEEGSQNSADMTLNLSNLGLNGATKPQGDSVNDRVVASAFVAPKPDWRDGATMEMPVIEADQSAPKSTDFRISSSKDANKPSKKTIFAIIATIVIALAVAAGVTYAMEIWGGKSVPDVTGMSESEATDALQAKGFAVRSTQVKSDDKEGIVLVEDPEGNSRLAEGSEVVIHITTHRFVPDVVGKSLDEAKSAIAAEGFENVTYTFVNSDEEENKILSITPEPNTRAKGSTAIEIKVAQPYCVPDVSGMSLSEAQKAINDAGLTYQVYYTNSEQYPDGTILGTQPAAEEKVKSDTVVTINVTRVRSAELISATRSLLAAGSTIDISGVSYSISSLDSVQYVGDDKTTYTITATPFVSLFGERLSGTTRTVSGTIVWTESNTVSSIASS